MYDMLANHVAEASVGAIYTYHTFPPYEDMKCSKTTAIAGFLRQCERTPQGAISDVSIALWLSV